jgi:hypothetical protein
MSKKVRISNEALVSKIIGLINAQDLNCVEAIDILKDSEQYYYNIVKHNFREMFCIPEQSEQDYTDLPF